MKYLSLFSGIGGFEYGIQSSKKGDTLQCVGYSEIDKYARSIYKAHYPNHVGLGDATKINTEDLPRFDLLVGGFPCQAFSHAGLRRGFHDTRGTLFFEICRILEDKRPEYFLLENVRGLLSHERGKTFQTMLRTLSKLGYDAQWEVYNSKNFSVPQNRERIYIKGYLRERERHRWEILSIREDGTETHATTTRENRGKLNDCIQVNNSRIQSQKVYNTDGISPTLCAEGGGQGAKTGLYDVTPRLQKVGNIRKNQRSESGDVYNPRGLAPTLCARDYKDARKIIVEANTSKTNHHSEDVCKFPQLDDETIMLKNNTKQGYLPAKQGDGVVLDFSNAKGRVQKKRSPTMTAHSNVGTVTSNLRVRRLTPRECERLQGFPDDWTKYGAEGEIISDTQRYKCIGNAVTTTVIKHILENWDVIR